ncbi:hypothetical protein JX265_004412 [Neoarthrinium moseri]|uniref:Uncharacterized protein n=1 Tax=Neoarthrinium moseri TaxID=1658444 RepID=A0A9Q0ASE6_9PEZI|nr:hypothetical protein JX266_003983 [Neoarthrinium moseri]KAI1875354.1 hypothetical protein JX265_004412 [Neoarthrinium moseri]
MAAAALMSPAPAYHPHGPSFPPSYSHQPPSGPMPGLISHGESSRRTSKDSEPSHRQSLPSISEMFSGKPTVYSPTTPTSMAGSQSLPPPPPPQQQPQPPSSFPSSASTRADPGPASQPLPPHFSQRPETTGPPGPVYQYDQRELSKAPEHNQRHSALSNPHAPPVYQPPPPGQLPPGQLPLSQAPPMSPRHMGPMPPFDPQRPPLHGEEEYGIQRRYDSNNLNRHFETWNYTDCLQRIAWSSRTICNFAEAYANIASEQHGGQPIPQRLPTEREVAEMLGNVDYLRKTIENVRDVVQHSIASEKAREGGKHKSSYDDDEVSMYGDGVKQHYGIGEVKKRRGVSAS